jgi:hypothetical protein
LIDGFEAAEEHLKDYRQNLPLPDNAAGVVVVQGDRVVGVDLFGSPLTFASQWQRLADAYFFDALHDSEQKEAADKELAASFIKRSATCAKPRTETLGLGTELEVSHDDLVGAALLYSGQVCHFAAFTEHE